MGPKLRHPAVIGSAANGIGKKIQIGTQDVPSFHRLWLRKAVQLVLKELEVRVYKWIWQQVVGHSVVQDQPVHIRRQVGAVAGTQGEP